MEINNKPEVSTKTVTLNNKDVMLVNVKNGLNQIGVCNINSTKKRYENSSCFYIANEPVLSIFSHNANDPYEDKIITQTASAPKLSKAVGVINAVTENLHTGFPIDQALMPLFEILSDGLYAVTKQESFPTDGDGNFFWYAYGVDHQIKGSSELSSIIPQDKPFCSPYLIPTKSSVEYNNSSAKQASEHSKERGEYLGLSYHICGMFSALLKGHYIATASVVDMAHFYTIDIQPVKDLWLVQDEENKQETAVGFKSETYRIPFEYLSEEQIETILITRRNNPPTYYNELRSKFLSNKNIASARYVPTILSTLSERYPDIEMIASAQGVGEITKAELNALLAGLTELDGKTIISSNYYSSVVAACNYLQYYNMDEFLEFALNIMKNPDLSATYNYLAERLMKIMDKRIKHFFDEVAIGNDPNYSKILVIAQRYQQDYEKYVSDDGENKFYSSSAMNYPTQSLNRPAKGQLSPEAAKKIASHLSETTVTK